STWVFVAMRGDIDDARIARVNDDVVNEKFGLIEIIEEPPVLAAVRRGVHLSVERAEIETLRIVRVNDERTHVAARRAGHTPVHRILRIGCGVRFNRVRFSFVRFIIGAHVLDFSALSERQRDESQESKKQERSFNQSGNHHYLSPRLVMNICCIGDLRHDYRLSSRASATSVRLASTCRTLDAESAVVLLK